VRVAETGGFSTVARELGTSQPTVSRTVAALEGHLGARLLHRSTRAVTLTDDGRQFYQAALHALGAVAEVEGVVGYRRGRPSGLLRLGMPVAFGRLNVAPRIGAFLERYPDVAVELAMSESAVDLVEEGIDLTIRIGRVSDPALITRRLGTTRFATVAAPAYLERHGEPRTPHDLAGHQCVVYTPVARDNRWVFQSAGAEPIEITVESRFLANNSEAVCEAAIAGAGIAIVPVWLFRDERRRTTLRCILTGYEPRPLPIHAVYPSRRHIAPKVRAMIDFLAETFRDDPLLSD
jgi:DNA-binding transcriptional LysR family regulator